MKATATVILETLVELYCDKDYVCDIVALNHVTYNTTTASISLHIQFN